MLCAADGKVIGTSQRQGQNGLYYLVSIVVDGDAMQFLTDENVYMIAKTCEFGEEKKVTFDLRRYGRDWGVRVNSLESY